VRRLRAKLGPEHEALIGTVRNVGYKFVRPTVDSARAVVEADVAPSEPSGLDAEGERLNQRR
jgi:DNA-binding winged helix-turn-helix (wHTH) protein